MDGDWPRRGARRALDLLVAAGVIAALVINAQTLAMPAHIVG